MNHNIVYILNITVKIFTILLVMFSSALNQKNRLRNRIIHLKQIKTF